MSIFQLIAIFFAASMLYVVNIHRRKQHLQRVEVSFWYLLWTTFIVLALFPNMLLGVVQILNFSRVFDLLLVLSMMILTTLIISVYFSQKSLSQKLETFVRAESLNDSTQKKTHEKKRTA